MAKKMTGPDAARAANSMRKVAPAKVKVGKDVIDFIKSQGMAATLKRVGSMTAAERKRDAEYVEGTRRMYGDRRLAAATAPKKPVAKSPDAARSMAMKKKTAAAPKYKSADSARRSSMK